MKKEPNYLRPTCREEIVKEKPNYVILETLELDSSSNLYAEENESVVVNSDEYHSENHEHALEKIRDNGWRCDGTIVLSGLDTFDQLFGRDR